MIDTVVLRIKHPDFRITSHNKFTPNSSGLFIPPYTFFNGQSYLKAVQNPTSKDKKDKNYKPRLTLIKNIGKKGEFPIYLKIEFSCPKLIFGNNFQELNEDEFKKLIDVLFAKLNHEMGVMVTREALRNAEITTIHFSKNIIFTDYNTASGIICDVAKINLTNRLDLNKTDFRNEGQSLCYYSKSHSFVLYDKVKDLESSESRAIEKDNQFNLQMSIFDEIRRKKALPLEVLRIEVRLCNRRKLEQLMRSLNIAIDLDFKSLFSKAISSKVLLDYWLKVHDEARRNALVSRTKTDLLESIFKVKKITPMCALTLFALYQLLKNESERKIKKMIETRFCKRTYPRLKKMIIKNQGLFYDRHTVFDFINSELHSFNSVRTFDFDF